MGATGAQFSFLGVKICLLLAWYSGAARTCEADPVNHDKGDQLPSFPLKTVTLPISSLSGNTQEMWIMYFKLHLPFHRQ